MDEKRQENLVFSLKGASFAYGDGHLALGDMNLTITSGERVALLGPNGSGKSTLLKLLDGLLFATSGEVVAFDRRLTEETLEDEDFAFAFRRRVGLVFQDPDVQLFSPTVWDEIAFAPLQLGLGKDETVERVRSSLELLNIEKLAERSPYHLSSGEKKRVCLASVLSLQPEVLLLDEPTAGLDPRSQRNLIDFLVRWQGEGKTLVTATQDLDIVEEIADRVYILDETNRLAAEGSPSELLADRELLLRTNLIHEHFHRHREMVHAHLHRHPAPHEHEH